MKYEVEYGHYGYGWDVVMRFPDGGKLAIATFHNNGAPKMAKLLAEEYASERELRVKTAQIKDIPNEN